MISSILVESESIELRTLPAYVRQMRGPVRDEQIYGRLRGALLTFSHSLGRESTSTGQFDRLFFGAEVKNASCDPRIQVVLDRIRSEPTGQFSARECANGACLSVSRFLHLFSAEVGTPFRRFKTWKRARTFLYYVTQNTTLTDVALNVGYPDATHFSHSIRQVYGLTPRSMFAGSRKLALYVDAAGRPGAAPM